MTQFNQLATDETVLDELGRRLREARIDADLTQADLATEAGVSKTTVENLEAGRSVTLSNFIRVIRALGLSGGFESLIPERPPSPLLELERQGRRRQRVRHRSGDTDQPAEPWSWAEDDEGGKR